MPYSNPAADFYSPGLAPDSIVADMEDVKILVKIEGRQYEADLLHEVNDLMVLVVVLDGPWRNKTLAVPRISISLPSELPPPDVSGLLWRD